MIQISGMVRRAFTSSSSSAPPESVKNGDSMTDTSRDSVEASNVSTPALLDSNAVSTAPSEPEGPKDVELSHEIIAKTIEEAILSTPGASTRTPAGKSTRSPSSPSSEPRRSAREKRVVATYNASILSGNAVHTRRAFRTHQEYNLAQVSRNLAAITKVNLNGEWIDDDGLPITESMASPSKSPRDSLKTESTPQTTRKSGRLSLKGRTSYSETRPINRKPKEAKEDTAEFARSLRPRKRAASAEPAVESPAPTKKARVSSAEPVEVKNKRPDPEKNRTKQWLAMGLYAGQTRLDSRRKNAPAGPERKHLPMPMFTGHLLLERGRNFVLPFEILNPLTKNQAPAWTNLRKNRFVGDALPTWKKKDHSTQSTCNCTKDTNCDNNCLNRSMRYECNEDNCRVGSDYCQNRAFQELKWRSKNKNLSRDPEKHDSNMWGVGIEVFKTENRGHGVRAMRSFEPNQAICEYTGEIVTQDEADRRMNEDYKGKTDYYLMTFHEGLIIDATKGSICRFVNHSCDPNCHVEKWVVNGEPRMALFANEDGIKVGEELTYDYNFAPYSQKNLQACLCGGESCRGVLGPRNLADQKTQKVVTTTKTVVKKKTVSRTPSLSPKKKPTKNVSPARSNPTGHKSAPAVGPVSKAALATQQKSRAERALKRSTGGKVRRKRVIAPPTTTIRRRSVKTATSVTARGKQIRRTFSTTVKSKPKPAVKKNSIKIKKTSVVKKTFVKSKRTIDDPFEFPASPPPSSPSRYSGRHAKPSPKARENSLVIKSVKPKKNNGSGLFRSSLSTENAKRTSSPLAVMSTPTSRISKRVITPSPKVRENANNNTVLAKSKGLSKVHLISGKRHHVSFDHLPKKNQAKDIRALTNDKEARRVLADIRNA